MDWVVSNTVVLGYGNLQLDGALFPRCWEAAVPMRPSASFCNKPIKSHHWGGKVVGKGILYVYFSAF